MHIVAMVLQILLGLMFLMAGFMKLGSKQQIESFNRYGYSQGFRVFTGWVELIGAIGLLLGIWYPVLAMLAGLLIAVTMIGAIFTHLKLKDPTKELALPIILLIASLVITILR